MDALSELTYRKGHLVAQRVCSHPFLSTNGQRGPTCLFNMLTNDWLSVCSSISPLKSMLWSLSSPNTAARSSRSILEYRSSVGNKLLHAYMTGRPSWSKTAPSPLRLASVWMVLVLVEECEGWRGWEFIFHCVKGCLVFCFPSEYFVLLSELYERVAQLCAFFWVAFHVIHHP